MPEKDDSTLRSNTLGVTGMVVAVVAFAAPLAASFSNIPLAIGLGDGVGAPGAWVIAAISLALFAVGYAAMSHHMVNAGAFYAYVSAGLGSRCGVAGGYISAIAYTAGVILITAFFGFFCSYALETELSIQVAWYVAGIGGLLLAGAATFAGVEMSVRVMTILLLVETAFLLIFNIGTLVTEGPAAYPLEAFSPSNTFDGSVGVALAFAFSTFLGFEATAIYSEEAKDPKRTVPRATYTAIILIAVLYTATAWSTLAALGPANAVSSAQEEPAVLLFAASENVLGSWAIHATDVLIVTSMFAVMIAALNSASRYGYALARDSYLPAIFSRTHHSRRTPYVAIATLVGLAGVIVAAYALAKANPITDLAATFVGLSTLGIVIMEVVVSIAVIAFFRRRTDLNPGPWRALIAPALAAGALTGAAYLVIDNFSLITGTESSLVARLPYLFVLAAIVGVIVGGRHEGGLESPSGQPDDPQTAESRA